LSIAFIDDDDPGLAVPLLKQALTNSAALTFSIPEDVLPWNW